jgi:hypothetical protein
VQEAAHGPASLRRAQHSQHAAGEEQLAHHVHHSRGQQQGAQARGVVSAAAAEEARRQRAPQEQVEVPEREAGAEDLGPEARRPAALPVVPLAPEAVVEAVHHRGAGFTVVQLALQARGERHRQRSRQQQVRSQQQHHQAPVAGHRADAGYERGAHG